MLPQSQVVIATYRDGASGTSGKERMPCSFFSRNACGKEDGREGEMTGGSGGQPSRLSRCRERKESQL